MVALTRQTDAYIKSPLNYIGGKYKILNQILPLFPEKIDTFVDLFAGGCNVGVNVNAGTIYCNDNLIYLIDMYSEFQSETLTDIMNHIENRIADLDLSLTNETGYKKLRQIYNQEKNPLDLFVLIAYSFNHQIRFNSDHEFNNPFGRERSCFNPKMRENLERFVMRLKTLNMIFTNKCFNEFDLSFLSENDFVYCDPPYLITTGSYNDGKRGFTGWSEKEELALLNILDKLNKQNVKFALSNVLTHKGKVNDLLKNWLNSNSDYQVNYLDFNYSNSSYHTIIRDKDASEEVLITNYQPTKISNNLSLFDVALV
ncbi:MAG: Dam family site-specific DNA-(adenine-N6)-methyltransferase [Candidatus Margulisbacteria bacterium]|jgi:DNA adenine methylase|nr:Dam family site-specific DNA-(adenine-N6)-methyltransferase [Candidatus Margulisiibacteriota bacterium]